MTERRIAIPTAVICAAEAKGDYLSPQERNSQHGRRIVALSLMIAMVGSVPNCGLCMEVVPEQLVSRVFNNFLMSCSTAAVQGVRSN
jgi:hypothetical protein